MIRSLSVQLLDVGPCKLIKEEEVHGIQLPAVSYRICAHVIIHRHMLCYLVCELSDPDDFVHHLREVPANEWTRFVSRASMASVLKISLQA